MSRQATNWIIILVVLAVTVVNPVYRHFQLKQPIVTLGLDLKGGVEVLLKADPERLTAAPAAADSTADPAVAPADSTATEGAGDAAAADDAAADSTETPAATGTSGSMGGSTEVTLDQLKGAMTVIENRIDPQGTKEIYLSQVGQDRILLQVPGEKNPQSVIDMIGDTALLEFVDTGSQSFPAGTNFNVEGTSQRKPEFAKYETLLTGADLQRSDPTRSNTGGPAIGFTFRPAAAEKFGQYTTNHVGQYLTVILDGVVLTSPVINGPIWGGEGIIEGQMTLEEVNRIVNQLNAGALPVPLTILSASIVGPTLGQESIDKSFMAGIIGFVIVMLFMALMYRLPGLISDVALAMYVVVVLGTMSLAGAALTLPGIAGFLLSVGMAIDANIIVYERLKEELRWGKTLHAALEASFGRGWGAIVDGQVATLIGAAVLYFLGTGPVKGFAVTLFIGNVLALFTGVFVTRVLLTAAAARMKNPTLYAPPVKEIENPRERLQQKQYFRFIDRSPLWFGISGILVAAGIAFMVINTTNYGSAFNLGIDYTGGEKIILETKEVMPVDGQAVAALVKKYSDGEATVQVAADNPRIVSIRMRPKGSEGNEADQARARNESVAALKTEIGNAYGGFVAEGAGQNPVVREQNYVGPTVGAELIRNALLALLIGSVLIFFYILWRFEKLPYSIAAILAILHNVLVTLAVTAFMNLEVNASFIAVILTIVGYSINDTIIIFDRLRENVRHYGNAFPLKDQADFSLTQTVTRSFNTVLMVIIMTVTLMVLGGENIRDFMIAMLAGLLATAYSSITIATPLMLWITRLLNRPGSGTVLSAAGANVGGGMSTVELGPTSAAALSTPGSEAPSMAAQVEAARERKERKSGPPKQRRR
jgi:SecD/SecF fusion protein